MLRAFLTANNVTVAKQIPFVLTKLLLIAPALFWKKTSFKHFYNAYFIYAQKTFKEHEFKGNFSLTIIEVEMWYFESNISAI